MHPCPSASLALDPSLCNGSKISNPWKFQAISKPVQSLGGWLAQDSPWCSEKAEGWIQHQSVFMAYNRWTLPLGWYKPVLAPWSTLPSWNEAEHPMQSWPSSHLCWGWIKISGVYGVAGHLASPFDILLHNVSFGTWLGHTCLHKQEQLGSLVGEGDVSSVHTSVLIIFVNLRCRLFVESQLRPL